MDRRSLLSYGAAGLGTALAGKVMSAFGQLSGAPQPVRVSVNEDQVLGSIPPDFIGLGYEISSVARPGLLSATNRVYVQMVRTLGTAGVIRIGGNTADYASYSDAGKPVSVPKGTVVTRDCLRELGTFLDATGWKLIWSVNLGEGKASEAVEEAQAVSEIAKDKLLALEIGNEVDLFTYEGHRKSEYKFADYLSEYRRFKTAIRAKLPHVSFAGPDVAGQTSWASQYAEAEAGDFNLLTEHYYRGSQNPASSLEMLLNPDPKLAPMLEALRNLSSTVKVPYRICETNSFSGGGKPGVSGTFGAALWVLEYMSTLATYNAAGVNIETGVNQLGFVSHYSPIGDDEHGTYTARPEYYGMLAFAHASGSQRISLESEVGSLNFSSFAFRKNRQLVITLINKDRLRQASVEISCKQSVSKATAMRLTAPSLESSTGVTLGNAEVTKDGYWKAGKPDALHVETGKTNIAVMPGTAAIVTLTL